MIYGWVALLLVFCISKEARGLSNDQHVLVSDTLISKGGASSSSSTSSSSFLQSTIFRRPDPRPISSPSSADSPSVLVPIPPSYDMQSYSFESREEEPYSGIGTFAHLNFTNCFVPESNGTFDIAIVGAPFDLGVTYRPGARFGPSGARAGARRVLPWWGYDMDHLINPFRDWATVTDCGDIQNSPFDKLVAIQQLEEGWRAINDQAPKNSTKGDTVRTISIGGDHTITLPALRALHATWGKVAVLHFDSHLDSWDPQQLGGGLSRYSDLNHGTMFHIAHEEGLISEKGNMHLGARCMLMDRHADLDNDARCGFSIVRAREIDRIGVKGVVDRIVRTVGEEKVYLSVDIDVLDPAFAPATGTIEPGGWTTRELLEILSGLSAAGLRIVGADVVEYTPVYDNAAETTGIAISQIVVEILVWMVKVPVWRK